MATQEPQSFWTPPVQDPDVPGLYLSEIAAGNEDEGLFRRMQHKIRIKTIRARRDSQGQTQYLGPTKFPEPLGTMIHVLVVDVTSGAGTPSDWSDLQALSLGNQITGGFVQDNVLGVFETSNSLGPGFDNEFVGNQYLRNRIHAMLYLSDTSNWRCSLNPIYHACIVINPSLTLTQLQINALNEFGDALSGLVAEWLVGVTVAVRNPSRSDESGMELIQFRVGTETIIQSPYEKESALPTDSYSTIVREKAYENWVRRGKPIGDDWTDWFAAEHEIGK